jgi:hypothetical protein
MKLSLKAALYSGLVYPGAGFFLMKRYWLVLLFALPATLAVGYIMYYVMDVAQVIAERIVNGQIPADMLSIRAAINKALAADNPWLTTAKIAFVISWLGSVPVSYWLGARAEKNTALAATSH